MRPRLNLEPIIKWVTEGEVCNLMSVRDADAKWKMF
jgi:hypothetical protein